MLKSTKAKSVDEYIKECPKEQQAHLKKIRDIIRSVAPKAEESISYMMPAYKLDGPLVYFGAFNKHVGLYAMPSGIIAFRQKLTKYKCTKGGIQFPYDQALPVGLIRDMVKWRVKENIAKAKDKKARK